MSDAALLEAREVTKSFAGVRALDGVSLAIRPGELVGLVGPDGAGKTSLLRTLVGLVPPDGGVTTVRGAEWKHAGRDARAAVGYMPQQYALYGDLSVDENLTFFGDLFGLGRDVFEARRARLLSITRLESARARPAGALSGGMYKKLAVACALLHSPSVVVLDEPTNGVDPVSRRELWALLYEFVGEGVGVLVATPYMDEAARCARVVLMHHGVVLASGEPGALTASLRHPVLEVAAAHHPEAIELLEDDPDVIAVTPAGERARAVVRAHAKDRVVGALAKVGAGVRLAQPDFEDLYLALVSDAGAGGPS